MKRLGRFAVVFLALYCFLQAGSILNLMVHGVSASPTLDAAGFDRLLPGANIALVVSAVLAALEQFRKVED